MTYYFACNRWLSRDEDDGLIERDLFPGDHMDPSPDMHYMAEVFTSDVRGAGTDADVSMELFGHMGSSGLQRLNVYSQAPLLCKWLVLKNYFTGSSEHAHQLRVLCCRVLCHAVLCYAQPFHAMSCCAML